MSHCDPDKLPENENLFLWLSIDSEGLELVQNVKGSEFIDKNKEIINKEKKIENFIVNNLTDNEPCPEELMNSVLNCIQKEKSPVKKCKWYIFSDKTVKIILPLCAMIILCASISLHIFFSQTNSNLYKKTLNHLTPTQGIAPPKNNNKEQPNFTDILLSSFERNLSNSDSETIQNKINSKVNSISINLKEFLDTNNDYKLVGYLENELDGSQIIQIIFDYKGDIVKVVVLPYSPTGIDLIKPSIENGTIKDIKRIENYFISILGNSNINTDLFQYISPAIEIKPDLEKSNDNKIITITPTNNIDNYGNNCNYQDTQLLDTEGALSNESTSSNIYETILTNLSSPI